MKKFDIPAFYRSNLISKVKEIRKQNDKLKKDLSPTILDFKGLKVVLPRHFGFCFGVENAIEIVYKALAENEGKKIYLLSEMIHNPSVNKDLNGRGVRFILDSKGKQLIAWDKIDKDDIVVVPAFGISLENLAILDKIGVDVKKYNTTCPFVERVWNKSKSIGKEGYTVIIHGKEDHEETKATFSRAKANSAAIVIRNEEEAQFLADVILKKKSELEFVEVFNSRCSEGFSLTKDLVKIAVVNQTTMLSSETQKISDILKKAIAQISKEKGGGYDFADTRDTLCYATNDNQSAALSVLSLSVDLVVVVGGKNSSNTGQLVKLFEKKFRTVFIEGVENIMEDGGFYSFDLKGKKTQLQPIKIQSIQSVLLTSGASCPDSELEKVMEKILELKGVSYSLEQVEKELQIKYGL